jgi:tRNA (adenine57-N1/adenine58-N1)-methyltransferase
MRVDIAPGKRVGEAGTGSGAMTAIFSRLVGREGRVYTYEHDIGLVNHARRNLRLDEGDTNIVIRHKPIDEGIEELDLDAFVLDVREPWKVIWPVYDALKPGGHLCILMPTTNQVSRTLQFLLSYDIWVTEIAEIMLRTYKNVPARLRPSDRMVGHTAFLIFGRKLIPGSFQQYQKITSYEEDEEMEMKRMNPDDGLNT